MKSMFQELLEKTTVQEQPQRLLFLFVDAHERRPKKKKNNHKGTLRPIMSVDKLPEELIDFKGLVKEADAISKDWDLVLVACLSLDNNDVPSTEDAEPYLDRMTNDIMAGHDLSGYVIFDRVGNPIETKTH